MTNPFAGANYLLRGFKMLFQPGMRRYVALPLSINTLLFAALTWFGAGQFNDLLNWLMPEFPQWLQWLSWVFWLLFAVSGLLIVFFAFSLLCNLVAAPFNALLASAIEQRLTGQQTAEGTGPNQFILTIVPMMVNEIKKLGYFMAWAIPLLLLFLIPVVNVAAPLIWFIFSAWLFVLEYVDYPMGNHGILFPDQRKRVRSKRLRSLGFGSAVSLATMTPILNFMVMPAAVAGATIYWVEQLREEDQNPTQRR